MGEREPHRLGDGVGGAGVVESSRCVLDDRDRHSGVPDQEAPGLPWARGDDGDVVDDADPQGRVSQDATEHVDQTGQTGSVDVAEQLAGQRPMTGGDPAGRLRTTGATPIRSTS